MAVDESDIRERTRIHRIPIEASSSSVAKNTAALMGSQIVTWASTLVLMFFLPRYLGPEGYGRLYFAISVTSLVAMIANIGIGDFLVKEVARDRTKVGSYFVNAAVMKGIAWFVSSAVLLAYVLWTPHSEETLIAVVILGVGAFFGTLIDLVFRVFQAFERLGFRSIASVVQALTSALFGVGVLLLGYGVIAMAVVMLVSTVLTCFTAFILLPRVTEIKARVTPSLWPYLLRGSVPFFISIGLSFLYYRFNVLMVAAMSNETVVGWYGAPSRLFDTLIFFPLILATAVFPLMSRLWQTEREQLARTAQETLNIAVIVVVPFSMAFFWYAEQIISLLFGADQFAESVVLLKILSLALPLLYVDFIFATLLNAVDRQRYTPIVALVGLVVNVAGNWMLIPLFQQSTGNGAIGAAIMTGVTELVISALFFGFLPPGLFKRENLIVVMKALGAGACMLAAVFLLGWWGVPWMVSCMIGLAMYVVVLLSTKAMSKSEFEFFLATVPFRRIFVNRSEMP
jgi:O-antigen/teichoic acid export membrane protein